MSKKYILLLSALFLMCPVRAEDGFKQPFKDTRTDIIQNPEMDFPNGGEWFISIRAGYLGSRVHKPTMLVNGSKVYAWLKQDITDFQDIRYSSIDKVFIDCDNNTISKPLTTYKWNSLNEEKIKTETPQYYSEMYADGGYRSDEKLVIREVCKLITKN